MKHRLSFGFYNIFANNVIEVTADEGIEMTLEMVEECNDFMNNMEYNYDSMGKLNTNCNL